jgi:hypothetical protein
MQTERDASFVLATPESEPLDAPEESALDKCQEGATPGDIRVTSPLVTPMSPQENNKKRTNNGLKRRLRRPPGISPIGSVAARPQAGRPKALECNSPAGCPLYFPQARRHFTQLELLQ